MKQNQRPTMKDVAEQAQVSVSTVSYVLNNNGQVSAERRARVLNAVRALDYTPNESARNLKRQSASTIGLVVPDLVNEFFSRLARGVVRAAAMHDMLVVLCSAENSEEAEYGNARLLRSRRVDGVIYESGFHESPRSLLELQSLGPVVLVDERIPGLDLPAVVADGRRGARDVATHVVKSWTSAICMYCRSDNPLDFRPASFRLPRGSWPWGALTPMIWVSWWAIMK